MGEMEAGGSKAARRGERAGAIPGRQPADPGRVSGQNVTDTTGEQVVVPASHPLYE